MTSIIISSEIKISKTRSLWFRVDKDTNTYGKETCYTVTADLTEEGTVVRESESKFKSLEKAYGRYTDYLCGFYPLEFKELNEYEDSRGFVWVSNIIKKENEKYERNYNIVCN